MKIESKKGGKRSQGLEVGEVLLAKSVFFSKMVYLPSCLDYCWKKNPEQERFGHFSMQILPWGKGTCLCCIFSRQWVAGLI